MRWIAARHGVPGHPVRPDRITADIRRLISGLDRRALRAELRAFVTEARPQWSKSRRTSSADDLFVQVTAGL
jgi:hypothetical protein